VPRERETKARGWSSDPSGYCESCLREVDGGLVPAFVSMVFQEVCAMSSAYEKDQKKSWAGGLKSESDDRYPSIAGAEKLQQS